MNEISSTCYCEVWSLYQSGDLTGALNICASDRCKEDPECRRFRAWQHYNYGEYGEAIEEFRLGITLNEPESYYGLASTYIALGEYEKSLELYKNAAQRGYIRANYWIGSMYRDGRGTPVDFDKAIQYFKIGSDAGYLVAKRSLIYIDNKKGGLFRVIKNSPAYFKMLFDVLRISLKDIEDERLADAPNAFAKRRPFKK